MQTAVAVLPKRPLDLDSFEQAIVADWTKELEEGKNVIKSLPPEIVGSVRQELIRFQTWMQLKDQPLLIVISQGKTANTLASFLSNKTYDEYKNVQVLDMMDERFKQKFLQAMPRGQQVIVPIEFSKFAKIKEPTLNQPSPSVNIDNPCWLNYMFMLRILPSHVALPIIIYTDKGESSFVKAVFPFVTTALFLDRSEDMNHNEGG